MSSNIIARFLPRGRFTSSLPSITSFKSPFPLNTCPIHFFFLLLITYFSVLFSFTVSNTCSFVILSFQLIFSIFLNIHISNACNLSISSVLIVHVCEPFYATLHTTALITFSFNYLSILCANSSLLLLHASFAIPILDSCSNPARVACEVFFTDTWKALNIQCYTRVGVQDKIKSRNTFAGI